MKFWGNIASLSSQKSCTLIAEEVTWTSFQSPDFHLPVADSLGEPVKYKFPEIKPQSVWTYFLKWKPKSPL